MYSQNSLFKNIRILKETRVALARDKSFKVAIHLLDMTVLELSQIADIKIDENESMKMEYMLD